MSRFTKAIAWMALALPAYLAYAQSYPNIGRTATDKEIAAWDIDVRPDFKGLPKGSGSVTKGMQVWEGQCASCHGTFGESNEIFTPIIGGTTTEDIKTGRVAALSDNSQPQRTTMMKVPTVSTLWDYINRAMPWTAPKSLSTEEVYAVTAYILNMAEVVPDDFVLSNENIAEVQNRMPNRNGMTTDHGMWSVKGKPDVASTACMKDCVAEPKIRSTLPLEARNVHGNIAEQNRHFGAVRGVDTTRPPVTTALDAKSASAQLAQVAATTKAASSGTAAPNPAAIAKQNACMACHGVTNKLVGPSFVQIAEKYKGDGSAEKNLHNKIKNGSSGTWGAAPMPPQSHVKDEDIKNLVNWILSGAK